MDEQGREEEHHQHIRCIDRIAMVFVGMINNIFFLIVLSSAQRIVDHFKATGLLGVVNWAVTFCGLFAGYINTLLSAKNVSYDLRFSINAASMGIGLLGCAVAPNFWMSCACILFVGFSCNFGESVTLGYLAYIHKQSLVKFWGIGTGAAGIFGSGYTILCIVADVNYKYSFLYLLPFVAVYFCSYFFVLRAKHHKPPEETLLSQNNSVDQNESIVSSEIIDEPPIKCFNIAFLKKISYYICTCDTTYFTQYVIATAFLDCAQTPELQSKTFLFPSLSLTQHVGVLIFCTSNTIFKCRYLGSIAVGQLINFCIWASQACYHWMPIWAQFIFIFFVGSCGGLSYVNTYDMILTDNRLSYKEKEIGSNIVAFSVTIAVLFSSIMTLISEKTYLYPYVPK